VEALERFHGKYKLNFPLAGDTSRRTLKAYGVWQEKTLYGRKSFGIVRTTYLIGSDGRIKHIFPKVKVDGHIEQVLAALRLGD